MSTSGICVVCRTHQSIQSFDRDDLVQCEPQFFQFRQFLEFFDFLLCNSSKTKIIRIRIIKKKIFFVFFSSSVVFRQLTRIRLFPSSICRSFVRCAMPFMEVILFLIRYRFSRSTILVKSPWILRISLKERSNHCRAVIFGRMCFTAG